ncbi:hypothetical protein VNI00_000927 [Paramarasmius palmivorus]|uniref:NAD(P)-binding domain-containing protein n=1 Tax=Paramarasmius palmivorus TaxID=297713 RepID=A0AAW0EAF4_9AGAR
MACGLVGVKATSIQSAKGIKEGDVTVTKEIPALVGRFGDVFGREMVELELASGLNEYKQSIKELEDEAASMEKWPSPVGLLATKELIARLQSPQQSTGTPAEPHPSTPDTSNIHSEPSKAQEGEQKPEHRIILFVRSPQKLPPEIIFNPLIQVVNAQLSDQDKLEEVMEGVDAVISALGPSVKRGPFHPSGEPLAKAYQGVIAAMKKRGVRRIFLLGTASMTAPEDKSDVRFTALVTGVATFARNAYKDVVAIGKFITSLGEEDQIDWTIVRVPLLTDQDNRNIRAGYIGDGQTSVWLARVGWGVWIVRELFKEYSVEEKEWNRKLPMLSSV